MTKIEVFFCHRPLQQHKARFCYSLFCCCLVLFYLILHMSTPTTNYSDDIIQLEVLNNNNNNNNNNIFFIETDESLSGFSGRLLCAFESAAMHNPDSSVYVVVAAEASGITKSPVYFTQLKNVKFVKVDLGKMFKDTPVEDLWESGEVVATKHRLNNISNLLRLVLLFRFGGMYLDSDVITLASMPNLANFVAANHADELNNAVLRFDRGHPFLDMALRDIAENFDGNQWGQQGPQLMGRSVRRYCHEPMSSGEKHLKDWQCPTDLTILPPAAAYPIAYNAWSTLFNRGMAEQVRVMINGSFAVHYWNNMRRKYKGVINMNDEHPIYGLFREHCPLTEKEVLRQRLGQEY